MKAILTIFIIMAMVFSPRGTVFPQDAEKEVSLLLSVKDARLLAISNNLDIKLAELDSKIKNTELSYKEAIFDTILNGKVDYAKDELKRSSSLSASKSITNNYNIGFDKKLKSGTDLGIDFTNKREWSNSAYVSSNPYHESQIELSLSQPIAKNFFGLIDRGNIEIVKMEIKNTELDSYIKIEDAIISAEKAYWNLVLKQKEFAIKKEMLKKAISLFNNYRRKLKIGLTETGDVLASEANMHIMENELLLASDELKSAQELLKIQLNLENEIKLFAVDSFAIEGFAMDLAKSLTSAFENRRDYLSRKNDVEAKKIKLKMKSNSRLPELDLKATFAANGISPQYYRAAEGITEDSNPKYYIGLEFKYPIENNEANSEYEKTSLEKTKAIVSLQKTERQIISDIDKNFRKLSVSNINISQMRRVESLQKGKLFQEEERFKYGRSNSDTLIRYQEDLLKAKLMTQKAYFDYQGSALDLMAAEDSFLKHIGLE